MKKLFIIPILLIVGILLADKSKPAQAQTLPPIGGSTSTPPPNSGSSTNSGSTSTNSGSTGTNGGSTNVTPGTTQNFCTGVSHCPVIQNLLQMKQGPRGPAGPSNVYFVARPKVTTTCAQYKVTLISDISHPQTITYCKGGPTPPPTCNSDLDKMLYNRIFRQSGEDSPIPIIDAAFRYDLRDSFPDDSIFVGASSSRTGPYFSADILSIAACLDVANYLSSLY